MRFFVQRSGASDDVDDAAQAVSHPLLLRRARGGGVDHGNDHWWDDDHGGYLESLGMFEKFTESEALHDVTFSSGAEGCDVRVGTDGCVEHWEADDSAHVVWFWVAWVLVNEGVLCDEVVVGLDCRFGEAWKMGEHIGENSIKMPHRCGETLLTRGTRAQHQERRRILRCFLIVETYPILLAMSQQGSPRSMPVAFALFAFCEKQDSLRGNA